jgi:hypothetical protein
MKNNEKYIPSSISSPKKNLLKKRWKHIMGEQFLSKIGYV